jgi:hypothetical protein
MFFEASAQENKIAWTCNNPGECFTDTNLESYPFVSQNYITLIRNCQIPFGRLS